MPTSDNLTVANLNPSISSAEAIPANPSAKPGKEPEARTQGIFGPSLPDYFAYLDLDTPCWKTSQATFLSDLETYSETWPDSGTMRNGLVYERQTSARPILESGSSLWPTAVAKDDGKTPEGHLAMKKRMGERDGTNSNRMAITSLAVKVQTLDKMWQTPVVDPSTYTYPKGRDHSVVFPTLRGEVENWPTPAARDYKSEKGNEKTLEHFNRQSGPSLPAFIEHSHQAPTIPDGQTSSAKDRTLRQRLNPRFVEWLMGLPVSWTEL